MQNVANLTARAMSAAASGKPLPTRTTPAGQMAGGQQTTPKQPRNQVLALVAQVFTRLEAIFPRTFSSAFPSADLLKLSKRELAQEIASWPALPTRTVVERAMSNLKREGSTWPPTIPVLVSMLAPTPEDFGMPAVGEAWREALAHAHEPSRHRWRHEAVRMAGNATGWWDLTHTTVQSKWPRLEKRFQKHYTALVNRVMAGEELVPRHLLQHDGQCTPAELAERAGRELAQRMVEEAGMPHSVTSHQGLAMLKAATRRA
ncbi:replication protein P [Halomonas cupida]|uniref:replication protein P n=1 Tax=Halomonas cupida TaxID=44933 RepID=UPI0039B517D3